jgi:adenylosuccinate synthase
MPEQASCTVIVGCQWGDEGKGKIVDVLAEGVDIVARYQGGANAGHTVHVDDEEFILHQIPSGILHEGKRCLLGNGVVLDVQRFFTEYDALVERGIDIAGRVGVSRRAQLLMPYHRVLDKAVEESAVEKIGTTGRGIGPAYEDKAGRRGVRVADLGDHDRLMKRIDVAKGRIGRHLERLGAGAGDLDREMEETLALGERLVALSTDVGPEISAALEAGRRVLLEGAQGTALDLDHGTYPFVTSSNTTAAAAATGTGIGPTSIDEVIGVVKAYTTRVGEGPLPSAFEPGMDARVRELGGEFGATTGRPRRCGWFDSVLARFASQVNGLTGVAVTKLDVLDTLPELRIATAYQMPDGSVTDRFPADTWSLAKVEPVYETLPGWQTPTGDVRRIEDLPPNARTYLDRIEELTHAPVRWVSVGTKRSQIVPVG